MAETMERSVLESKERGELAIIAGAIGIKVAPRLGKDKIIDAILTSAGISTSPAPKPSKMAESGFASAVAEPSADRPRRGRPKKNSEDVALSFNDAPTAQVAASTARSSGAAQSNGDSSTSTPTSEPRTNDRGRNDRGDRNDPGARRLITSARPPRGGAPTQASFDPFADAPTAAPTFDPSEEEWAFAAAKPPRTSGDAAVATPESVDDGANEGNGYPSRRERNRGRNRDRFERGDRPERAERPEATPGAVGVVGAETNGEPRAERGARPTGLSVVIVETDPNVARVQSAWRMVNQDPNADLAQIVLSAVIARRVVNVPIVQNATAMVADRSDSSRVDLPSPRVMDLALVKGADGPNVDVVRIVIASLQPSATARLIASARTTKVN